jgi:deoxyribose-phosphate aldolase
MVVPTEGIVATAVTDLVAEVAKITAVVVCALHSAVALAERVGVEAALWEHASKIAVVVAFPFGEAPLRAYWSEGLYRD